MSPDSEVGYNAHDLQWKNVSVQQFCEPTAVPTAPTNQFHVLQPGATSPSAVMSSVGRAVQHVAVLAFDVMSWCNRGQVPYGGFAVAGDSLHLGRGSPRHIIFTSDSTGKCAVWAPLGTDSSQSAASLVPWLAAGTMKRALKVPLFFFPSLGSRQTVSISRAGQCIRYWVS